MDLVKVRRHFQTKKNTDQSLSPVSFSDAESVRQ